VVATIVVHGGAGARPAEGPEAAAAREGCARALALGHAILLGGGGALDAVQAAVRALEDDERFNAGRGSALTREGTVEMDAAIMSGAGLRLGGVAAVSGVRNPIDLARAVLDDGEHALLVGEGALAFAREAGVALCSPDFHVTERARGDLAREIARRSRPAGGGTVGAVAVDAFGHLAAATSTGGLVGQRVGRVGDSPLPGAGTYADDEAGAASATGHGERIMQVALTKTAIELLRGGRPAQEAAAAALATLDRVSGRGGLIVVDRAGGVGVAFNTTSMSWASST
jgi:beta-aspartyl-peptidase (threonine type)